MISKFLRLSLLSIFCLGSSSFYAQCTALSLPYTENFSSVSLGSACSWTSSTVSSGAGWLISSPAYAGSAAPEVKARGVNACAGCVQTISLTLTSPLNTATVTSLDLSFLHKLYVTNQATSGPGNGTLMLQTSSDGINWINRWSTAYTVSGSALTSILSGTVNVPAFNPAANETYIRFAITGVMFKVWGWLIDDVSATSPITTSIKTFNELSGLHIGPNPVTDVLVIETGDTGALRVDIYDINGKLAKQAQLSSSQSSVSTSELEQGIYFAKITSENGEQKTFKFLKFQ